MLKLYITRLLSRQSFIVYNPKNYSRSLRRIVWMLFGLIIIHPSFAGNVAPGPASENFDEVTVNAGGYSQGSSPRTIGDWIFNMIDNTGANDGGAFLDVTNSTSSSHLADNGNDKALNMNGSYNISTTAVIKPAGGEAFSLISFNIENGYASSPNYRVVGFLDGTQVVTQDFTAKQYNQAGPYTVTLSDAKWKNIDEFHIVRQDGSADVSFYIDDIEVSAIAVNNPPAITSNGGGSTASANVVENTTAVTTVTASDADAGTTLTYSINGGADQNLFSIDGATGALKFKAAPDFENPSDADGDNNYEVTVAASDGSSNDQQTISVTVTDANDNPPAITSNGGGSTATINIGEGTTAVATVTASDADAGTTLTYSITGGADQNLFSIDGATGALKFKAAPDFENPSDADGDNNYEVTVAASDGSSNDQQTISVTVTDANDNPPAITSNGGGSTATINIGEGTTAVTTVTASDADAGTTLTYSINGGADQNLFSIDGATGALKFKAAPDFENPSDADGDNNYEVTVAAFDGSSNDQQTISVTVTDANDNPPAITSNGGGSTATINIGEGTTAVATVTATDADAGTTLTYSITGGADQNLFSIDGATGALKFKAAPDFENPSDADGDNNYEVTVAAFDGSSNDQQTISVTVTDANDNPPAITSNGGGSTATINIGEGTTAVTTVTASDADAGTTLTYSINGGADQNLFSIDGATGALKFKAAPDFENPSDADGDNNYEITVGVSDGAHTTEQAITVNITDVLPVTLISFTAKAEKNSAKLQWSTATEINNKAFIISRSANGQIFTEIGRVEGAGNSTLQKDYVFYDKNPLSGLNFYRLQQVDFDGRITSHGIRKVEFSLPADATISLYPNPVANDVKVIFAAGNYQQIQLTDNNGKVLQAFTLSAVDTQKTLHLKNLAPGVYYIRFTGNGKVRVRKVVKE